MLVQCVVVPIGVLFYHSNRTTWGRERCSPSAAPLCVQAETHTILLRKHDTGISHAITQVTKLFLLSIERSELSSYEIQVIFMIIACWTKAELSIFT